MKVQQRFPFAAGKAFCKAQITIGGVAHWFSSASRVGLLEAIEDARAFHVRVTSRGFYLAPPCSDPASSTDSPS